MSFEGGVAIDRGGADRFVVLQQFGEGLGVVWMQFVGDETIFGAEQGLHDDGGARIDRERAVGVLGAYDVEVGRDQAGDCRWQGQCVGADDAGNAVAPLARCGRLRRRRGDSGRRQRGCRRRETARAFSSDTRCRARGRCA